MDTILTQCQHNLILSACPTGTTILHAEFVRTWLLPCPMRVEVQWPNGTAHVLILRLDRDPDGVVREAQVLPILKSLGLPVPRLLAGPAYDSEQPDLGAMTVISLLPGDDLLTWGWRVAVTELARIEEMVVEAVMRLQSSTPHLEHHHLASMLPRYSLLHEL